MKRFFLALVFFCGRAEAFPPGTSPSLSAPQAVSLLQAQLGQSAQTWRPVSTSTSYATNFGDGQKTTAMSRFLDQISTRSAVSAIRVCYSNFGGVASGITTEGDGQATLTITASVEIHQTIVTGVWAANTTAVNLLPVFFNGSRTLVLSPAGFACSDPVSYPFVAGQNFYERTYVSASNGTKYPITRNFVSTNYEGINNSSIQAATISSSSTPVTAISGTLTAGATPIVLPVVPGSLVLYGGTITGLTADDGAGHITGTGVAASSTITYSTGAVTLNLTTAAAPNSIHAYAYGASGTPATDETLTAPVTDLFSTTAPQPTGYGPTMVLGLTNTGSGSPLGILVVGDSINFGSGNSSAVGVSWVNYATSAIGLVKEAQISETACTFANPIYNRRRLSLASGFYDRVIENYATNDMFGGTITLSALQTCKLAVWAQLAKTVPGGIKNIYATTLLPRTVSAASQTPLNAEYGSGTVASGSPSVRNAYNAWLFTQVGVTIGGVIDTASCIEASPGSAAGSGSGQWLALTDTFDGTHPSTAGHQLIGTCVAPGGSAASSVFMP